MGIVAEIFVIVLMVLLVITLLLVVALIVYAIILTTKLRKITASLGKAQGNIREAMTRRLKAVAPLLAVDLIKRFMINEKTKGSKKESGDAREEDN